MIDQLDQLDLFTTADPYGWMGTVAAFLETHPEGWLQTLAQNYATLYAQQATQSQRDAWADSYGVMQSPLAALAKTRPASADWTMIFEYELPREGGRRPDLVMLAEGNVLVLEFKQKSYAAASDRDQAAAYARDLTDYHSGCRQQLVTPILVPTRGRGGDSGDGDTGIASGSPLVLYPNGIEAYLRALPARLPDMDPPDIPPDIDPQAWGQADYAPLPTVIQAARQIFQHEPLPDIKRARSARIPEVMDYLHQLAAQAAAKRERHLVLVTGVPGAGKTLVGLQFVHQHPSQNEGASAVFLSGNGPLIQVLQYALKSKVFVQAVRNFYIQHQVRRQTAPAEHIIVFDEAQRAWDAERMQEKYGIESAAAGAVLRIAQRIPNWCIVLGLIGEGQEIHVGEEEGTEQWNGAISAVSGEAPWQVHCSPEQAGYFTALSAGQIHADDRFNLTTSLRSHRAADLQTWVAHLLDGELAAAAALMPKLRADGCSAYLTRDLEAAKAYCRDRYAGKPAKRYGLMASSRARNLADYGLPNDYLATRRVKPGPWYIDPPDSPLSCCALDSAVTEFGCQGLELDFPVVGWGDDLRWDGEGWTTTTRQKNVTDPRRLRINSYRVLLTRGRDGFVVFAPPEGKMDQTAAALQAAGLLVLPAE
ncbi:MAG: DNA/RNA helicase domain-containing protein [Elainellaceae cyanobacterium]